MNKPERITSGDDVDGGHLRAFIERVERLDEERRTLVEDITEVYKEAKSAGFDVEIMRKVVALRRQDRDKRAEEQAILDTYLAALGDLTDTPLGRTAINREFGAHAP